ncbi:MAG: deoxyribonuclease IV, partial [Acidobacteria bacterium]|nr:deoxyribonuclease IV [Acidobacteriota bacterium]
MVLLEGTAGCVAQIGCRFEDLRNIRDLAAQVTDRPVGYCLDTCHLLAAGFDIAGEEGLEQTVREAESVLGWKNIRVIHANDSKAPLGSHVDRHANIGEGYIGKEGFRRILAHPKMRSKPFILETPRKKEGDDRRNLRTLKSLCPKSHTTTTRSS